jgi:hypothetical protein
MKTCKLVKLYCITLVFKTVYFVGKHFISHRLFIV